MHAQKVGSGLTACK